MGNIWWKTLIQQTTSSLCTLLLYSDRSSLLTIKCCLYNYSVSSLMSTALYSKCILINEFVWISETV